MAISSVTKRIGVRSNWTSQGSAIITLASIAVVVVALYLAQGLLVPMTLAVLLSFLLSPVCNWLEHRGLRRIPAVVGTAIVGFTLLGLVAWAAALQMRSLAPSIPVYQDAVMEKFSSVNKYATSVLSTFSTPPLEESSEEILEESSRESYASSVENSEASSLLDRAEDMLGTSGRPISVHVIAPLPSPWQVFGGMFGTMIEVLGTIGIVIVLVVFFLVRREDLRDRFIHLVGRGSLTLTTHMLEDAATRVSRYLSMLLLLNVSFGISVTIGLYLIGIPNAILWGILGAILRFVPYIGPWIAAVMPIGLSLAISSNWTLPALTVGLFVGLELLNNNILEPWLYGRNTGVSAVAILVSAVFWMWLWGPVGLLVATPLTVCLLVVGKHVPQLSFLGIMLGNEPVFDPKTRIYQRLLAGDSDEATNLLEEYLSQQSLIEVYDTVLIPALILAEKHWHRDELDEHHHRFILQSLHEMSLEGRERQEGREAIPKTDDVVETDDVVGGEDEFPIDGHPGWKKVRILSLPAHTEADEVASFLLAQVIDARRFSIDVVSSASMADELDEIVEEDQVGAIIISATPPAAVMHARHLCQRIHARFPNIPLIVGLWDASADLSKAKQRIGCGAAVVTSLVEASVHLQKHFPSELPPTETRVPTKLLQSAH